MRYVAEGNWLIGRALVAKVSRTIVLPESNGAKGITRHYLIEDAGVNALDSQGRRYNRGDMVVAKFVYDMHFYRGHRVVLQTTEIICRCEDYSLDDFVLYPDNKPIDDFNPSKGNGAEAPDVTGAPA